MGCAESSTLPLQEEVVARGGESDTASSAPPATESELATELSMESTAEFNVRLERARGERLGVGVGNVGARGIGVVIKAISDTGLVQDWNKKNPSKELRVGLRIKQVNGETDYWGILEELHKAPYLDITVEDNPDCVHRVHSMPDIEAEGSLVLRFSSPCQHEHGSAQPAVLPHVRAGDAGVDQCCICLADVQPDDTLVQLPCKHAFHAVCAGRWLISNKRQRQCPLCKRSVDCSTAGEDSPSPARPRDIN